MEVDVDWCSPSRFLVCEPIAGGLEHVPFNAGLLRIIRTSYPAHRVIFCAEVEHASHVRSQLGETLASSIEWEEIVPAPRSASTFRRFPSDFRRIKVLLAALAGLSGRRSDAVCVLTSGNAAILWSLKLLINTFHRGAHVQVVLHGDFSKLRYRASLNQHLNPVYHLGSFRAAIKWACDRRIQYVVLEESVREVVVDKYPALRNRFRVLEHPLSGDSSGASPMPFTVPLRFGFLGRAYESKGFSSFLKVAVAISNGFPGSAEFHLIGSINERQQKQFATELSFLASPPETATLSRDHFLDRLSRMHFICLFYDESYEFTASGVLLDCVEWRKPIVASMRSLFVKLERDFHDVGYLCDDDHYCEVISQILIASDAQRYLNQVEAMVAVGESRSPQVLARKYTELVDELLKPGP